MCGPLTLVCLHLWPTQTCMFTCVAHSNTDHNLLNLESELEVFYDYKTQNLKTLNLKELHKAQSDANCLNNA